MSCCSGRCFIITLCVFQMVFTIERQVFDFLGYMWAPIIGNFLQIVFIIIGLFGAYQYRPKFLVLYAVWSAVWLGWNIFIICLYLEVGSLSRESTILSIGSQNKSWWVEKRIYCQMNSTSGESGSTSPLEQGCVEIVQAGIQSIMALMGFVISCYVIYVFTEEDDSSPTRTNDIEFIKTRYRPPARSSFRDLKKVETLNRSNFNSQHVMRQLDNGAAGGYTPSDTHSEYSRSNSHTTSINPKPNLVQNSNSLRTSKKSRKPGANHRGELPWVRVSPSPNKRGGFPNSSDDMNDVSLEERSDRDNPGYPGNYTPTDEHGPYPYTFDGRPRPAVMV